MGPTSVDPVDRARAIVVRCVTREFFKDRGGDQHPFSVDALIGRQSRPNCGDRDDADQAWTARNLAALVLCVIFLSAVFASYVVTR